MLKIQEKKAFSWLRSYEFVLVVAVAAAGGNSTVVAVDSYDVVGWYMFVCHDYGSR